MISTEDYCIAFGNYLRKGTPIRLSTKQDRQTESYVWRTMHDAKVRTEHRYNDGRIFRRDDPGMLHPQRLRPGPLLPFALARVDRKGMRPLGRASRLNPSPLAFVRPSARDQPTITGCDDADGKDLQRC